MNVNYFSIAFVAILALTQYSSTAFAQSDSKKATVHLGLVYPLSTHGIRAVDYSNAFSLHALAGVSKEERTLSISGVANIIKEEAKGAQISGFLNSYGSGKGFQLAGFANLARNDVKGVQLTGFLNKAANVHGVQFAGFINIADSSDYPIGIINLIDKGSKAFGISVDEDLTTLLSFRSGGRVMYGIIGLGYNLQNTNQRYAFEAGIGAHLLSKNGFTLNTEVSSLGLIDFEGGMYNKGSLRILPTYKLKKGVEIYAGPTASHIYTNTDEGKDLIKNTIWKHENADGEMNAVNVGFLVGVQVYL